MNEINPNFEFSDEAIEYILESIDRMERYEQMTNDELADLLIEEVWGDLNARDPRVVLLMVIEERLRDG